MMRTVAFSNLLYSVIFSFLRKYQSQTVTLISLLTSGLPPPLCYDEYGRSSDHTEFTEEAKIVPGDEKGVKEVELQVLFNIKVAELDQRSYDALITLLLQ